MMVSKAHRRNGETDTQGYKRQKVTGSRSKIMNSAGIPPPLTALPDVNGIIFSFLDDKSIHTATRVSKSFNDALTPHRRFVSMLNFSSFEDFRKMKGVVSFLGHGSNLVTDSVLHALACNDSFPRLARVDLTGCKNVTVEGMSQFVKDMGSRLEGFAMPYRGSDDVDLKDLTMSLARAPKLSSLSLVIRNQKDPDAVAELSGHESLRELKVFIRLTPLNSSGRILPTDLPHLEVLKLYVSRSHLCSGSLYHVSYPQLRRLEIEDSSAKSRASLVATYLRDFLRRAPNLESLTFCRMGSAAEGPLEKSFDVDAYRELWRAVPPKLELDIADLTHDIYILSKDQCTFPYSVM